MLKKQTVFYGYRGTTLEKAKECIQNDTYEYSEGDDEYFGSGIYFFENDALEAYCWAKWNREIPEEEIGVIFALIETEKVLDFLDRKTLDFYAKFIFTLIEKYRGTGRLPLLKMPWDCRAIDMICRKGEYLLVKGPYSPNMKKINTLFESGYTRIKKTHIQLCVRNPIIIREKVIVNNEEIL